MKPKSLLAVLTLLALLSAPVAAQSGAGGCVIRVEEPHNEQEVGFQVNVRGTAKLPPGLHLRVFARPETHHATGEWWPQNEGNVSNDNDKRWRVTARLGTAANKGEYFDLAVAAFEEKPHQYLVSYLREGHRTGRFDAIEMPVVACPPVTPVVKKTSHIEL